MSLTLTVGVEGHLVAYKTFALELRGGGRGGDARQRYTLGTNTILTS